MDQGFPGSTESNFRGKNLDGLLARISFLEENQVTLRKELDELRSSTKEFSERVVKTLWISETIEAIASTIGAPARKGLEIAIGALIIYMFTHVHIGP